MTQSQMMQVLVSSVSEDWYTPPYIIEKARELMGYISLDPASCEFANAYIKADAYYDKERDGLHRPWYGRVFLNPPYGRIGNRSSQGTWAHKMEAELEKGNMEEGLLLVRCATGYPWFEQLWDKWPACFIRNLIAFYKADGTTGTNVSKHSNTLFYIAHRPHWKAFARTFVSLGRITTPDGHYYTQDNFQNGK